MGRDLLEHSFFFSALIVLPVDGQQVSSPPHVFRFIVSPFLFS
jgi:hypothetical protein